MNIEECLNFLESHSQVHDISISKPTRYSKAKFMSLDADIQNQINFILSSWLSVFEEIPVSLEKNRYERYCIEQAEKKMGLTVLEDFKNKLLPGDIIEIYDLKTGQQLYRNIRFLELCSYDVLTMLTHSFEELFERSEEFHKKLVEKAEKITLSSEVTKPWDIEDHFLKEKMDPQQKTFKMTMKYISPVFKNGERVAWASTLRAELVGSAHDGLDNVEALY